MRTKIITPIIAAIFFFLSISPQLLLIVNADGEEEYYNSDEAFDFTEDIPDDFEVPSIRNRALLFSAPSILPSFYDGRIESSLPPVRNQEPWQLCWAFSALGSAESNLISKGMADSSINLSEMHLGYFFEGKAYDPIGFADGDATYYLATNWLETGNNNKYTTFALANWIGAADENSYPYDSSFYNSVSDDSANDTIAHLKNAYWISASDTEEIKKYVMQDGAVGIAYYQDDSRFYDDETNAYYNSQYITTNHSVLIVGWDDNYSVDNFLEKPPENGAWLIKNSLGSDKNDGGYFWLSYYDTSITSSTSVAFVYDFSTDDGLEHNYHYDGSYGTRTIYIPEGGAISAVFTAQADKSGFDELLKAVGFASAATLTEYDVQIYKGLASKTDPTSGAPVFQDPIKGKTLFTGYYTVDLPEPVRLREGELFSVVIRLYKPGMSELPVFVDQSYRNGGWIEFVSAVHENETFYTNTNQLWSDFANEGAAARIKALTISTNEKSIQELSFAENHIAINEKETFTQEPVTKPEAVDGLSYIWESSDNSVATVDDNGVVTGISAGEVSITARHGDYLEASYTLTVRPEIMEFCFTKDNLTLSVGDVVDARINMVPENIGQYYNIRFESSNPSIATIEDGSIKALSQGETTITAHIGDRVARCFVTVLRDLSPAKIIVKNQIYSGKAHTPKLDVILDSKYLTENQDYVAVFENNIEVGNATVTITGIGYYIGMSSAEFTIRDNPVDKEIDGSSGSDSSDTDHSHGNDKIEDADGGYPNHNADNKANTNYEIDSNANRRVPKTGDERGAYVELLLLGFMASGLCSYRLKRKKRAGR